MTYEIHPAANMFPEMSEAEFNALVGDIEEHGQIEPIKLLDGKIIDGRHRYKACVQLGVEPRFADAPAEFADCPDRYVESENLHRRHLTLAQKLDTIKALRASGRSLRQIAETVNLNPTTVMRHLEGVANATPDKVTGADGKQYPATRPAKAEPAEPRERKTVTRTSESVTVTEPVEPEPPQPEPASNNYELRATLSKSIVDRVNAYMAQLQAEVAERLNPLGGMIPAEYERMKPNMRAFVVEVVAGNEELKGQA